MTNQPRGVGVFTALAVIATIIIGGIMSVRSSATYTTDTVTPSERQAQVAAPAAAVQGAQPTPSQQNNTEQQATSTVVELNPIQE